jgi:hypothetical protein
MLVWSRRLPISKTPPGLQSHTIIDARLGQATAKRQHISSILPLTLATAGLQESQFSASFAVVSRPAAFNRPRGSLEQFSTSNCA